jgi:tetratricopeptide (TPR) repeat protein
MKNTKKIFAEATELYQQNRFDEAETLCEKIVKINPKDTDALHFLGVLCMRKNQSDRAVAFIKKAISLKPQALYYRNLAAVFGKQGKHGEAIAMYEKAIAHNPNYDDAYYSLGVTLKETGKINEAIVAYEKAIALNPNYADSYNNLGVALHELGKNEDAIVMFTKAIALNPQLVDAHNNLGVALREIGNTGDAIPMFAKAIDLNPEYGDAYNNVGMIFTDMEKTEDAMLMYEKAIALKPGYADAYWNKSLALLKLGNLDEGFELYEWRWQTKFRLPTKRHFQQPLWLGKESLQGKTILIYSEQGYGDTIQFCRYIAMVAKLGCNIIFEVEEVLFPLMSEQLKGVSQVVSKGEAFLAFDYHCPLLSLPLAFKTSLETISSSEAYLYADTKKAAIWENRLGEKTKLRVGIVWSGSVGHKNDRHRSINLETLLQYLPNKHEYICLQKELRANDAKTLENSHIHFFGDELHDFSDTAALVSCMDFVVSVDTSVAHLAGSLGKTTFILLPFSSDWRWLQDRNDSPWYSSVKLLRQKAMNDWESVLESLASITQLD